ncbi:MAG: hypothetical protein FJZ56_02350 [Chlamydiae bacterium]|nr:hypothetical protein [Chlamydiota bacterium]
MDILAIRAEKEYVKFVLMEFHRKKIRLVSMKECKKDLIDIDAKKAYIASALSPEDVLVRKIDLPLKSRQAIKKALPFQIESLIPEEAKVITKLLPKKTSTEVHLYAFRETKVKKHLLEMQQMGFDPIFVTSIPLALEQFAKQFLPKKERLIVMHFGWQESYYIDIKEQTSRVVRFGFKDLLDAVEIKYLKTDNLSATQLLSLVPEMVASRLAKEHERVLDALKKNSDTEVFSIAYTGHKEAARALLQKDIEEVDIVSHLEFDEEMIASYAVEIGIALATETSLQFRQNSKRAKKELKRALYQVMLAASFTFFTLFSFVHHEYIQEKKEIGKLYQDVSFSQQMNLDQIKKEYVKRKQEAARVLKGETVSKILRENGQEKIRKIEYIEGRVSIEK